MTAWVRGVLPNGWPGSNVYVLWAECKEHKHFRPGTRPVRSVTGVSEKIVYVPNVYVPFLSQNLDGQLDEHLDVVFIMVAVLGALPLC